MRTPKPRPIEGEDYYMEGGRVVFTAAYHLKRGYCCNSKCRHCPYGNATQHGQAVQIVMPSGSKLPE
jgi:Family of unknown function (DUF5522)